MIGIIFLFGSWLFLFFFMYLAGEATEALDEEFDITIKEPIFLISHKFYQFINSLFGFMKNLFINLFKKWIEWIRGFSK